MPTAKPAVLVPKRDYARADQRHDEQHSLDDILPIGLHAERREAIVDDANQQHANRGTDDMESARA